MTQAVQEVINVTPPVFLPYQRRWVADKSRVRVAEKSRRIGISWTAAGESALEAAKADGCDTWYIGYNKEMAEEFIRDVAVWARAFDMAASEYFESVFIDPEKPEQEILTFVIRFASGFRVTALSSRPTNLRNKKGRIIIDEAAHHDDLKGLLKAAMAVLMWGGRSRVDIISTHNGVQNYFNRIIEETRAGKRPYSVHRVTIDDALHDGLFHRICLVNNWVWTRELERAWREDLFDQYQEAAQEELLCIPAMSGGTYLHRGVVERQMRPGVVPRLVVPSDFVKWPELSRVTHIDAWLKENVKPLLALLPKDKYHFMGEDFGRVNDRTCLAPGYLDQDLTRKVPFVVELLNVPYEQQKQVAFYILDGLPRLGKAAFDATGNGGYLAEACLQKYGEKTIECVSLTDVWYHENLPKFKAALDDEEMELVKDADHLMDLAAFKVIDGRPKLPKTKTASEDGPPRHGDAGIAYLLAHYASLSNFGDYDYKGAKEEKRGRRSGVLPDDPDRRRRTFRPRRS